MPDSMAQRRLLMYALARCSIANTHNMRTNAKPIFMICTIHVMGHLSRAYVALNG